MPARPTYMSRIPAGTDTSAADVGSTLLGYGLFRQGINIAGVLEAKKRDGTPLYPEAAVEVPRRGQKTTSIWATLLGRCATQPGHKVVTSAQDGNRARRRWAEVARALEPRAEDLGIKIRWSNGDESFEWANGSRLWVVPPIASAFRGEAADTVFLDEGGELSPERSDDLTEGVLPLMDTRPMGQVIIAGTPGQARTGMFWTSLQAGRRREAGQGIVDYCLKDDETLAIIDEETGEVRLDERLLKRIHPGIGTQREFREGRALTTIAVMRQRFAKMQLPSFEREYGCRWPADSTTRAVDPEKWAEGLVERVPLPERVGVAFDCASDGTSASVVYAWRDEDGVAYLDVVAHRAGTLWVPRAAADVRRHYPRVPLGYDAIGANLDPAAAIAREARTAKFERMQMKEIAAATQRFVSLVSEGKVRHFGQSDLDAAIDNSTFRDLAGGRAFRQRQQGGAAINPLVAATVALWTYDKGRDRQPITIAV